MCGKSEKLIRLLKENENAAGAVEVLLKWANKVEDEEATEADACQCGQPNQGVSCEEVIEMMNDEEKLFFEIERFRWLCNPFSSLDIREALSFGRKLDLDADKIIDLAEQYSKNCDIPFEELDIVYIVYEHVLQDARNRIYEATGYDFINDGPREIYTYGNFMATSYDYIEEAKERLIAELAKLDIERRE